MFEILSGLRRSSEICHYVVTEKTERFERAAGNCFINYNLIFQVKNITKLTENNNK